MDRNKTRSQKGASNLGILLSLLFTFAGIFVAYQVLPFYYSFYELQGLMESQAEKASEFKDGEIIRVLTRTIKKLNIPADPENIRINRLSGRVIIELNYSEILFVDFGGGYDYDLWEFEFNPKAEKPL